MPLKWETFKIDGQPEREKFARWQHRVSRTFVPLDVKPDMGFDSRMFKGEMHTLNLGDLRITEVAATPQTVYRTDKLILASTGDFIKFGMQLSGDCLLQQGGRDAAVRTGDFAMYDTARPYTLRLGGSFRTRVLLIPRRRLLVTRKQVDRMAAKVLSNAKGEGAMLWTCIGELVSRLDEFDEKSGPSFGQSIVYQINALLAQSYDNPDLAGPSFAEITSFIELQLGNADLDPEMIARHHHIRLRELQKIFQREDATITRWIRDRRLEHCFRDLQDPSQQDKPVWKIAARWGMHNPESFNKAFRAAYNRCPTDVRNESLHRSSELECTTPVPQPPHHADGAPR